MPHLHLKGDASPVRRVYIPKPGTPEQRPLGIPTMADRAKQAWVKHVVEPAWEVQFEPNSYGFRPGRSTWDAIGAISVQINQKPTWGLDADITKCFDRLDHEALLRKLNTAPTLGRQIKAWLQGGLLDQGAWFPTEAGTPQGGPRSPWLANVALHGLEEAIARAFPGRGTPAVIRYADDLVALHPKREVIERCQAVLAEHLHGRGWELKPSKTRITQTLHVEEGEAGFDFLGFNSTVCSHETFAQMDEQLRQQLRSWIRFRHPNKSLKWGDQKDWRGADGRRHFMPRAHGKRLWFHTETPIQRHVKVQGRRTPYDGDEVYWGRRRAHHPGTSKRVARLLRRQDGRCTQCGYAFKAGDGLEVDHRIPRIQGGSDDSTNWQLLHRHCHVEKTARERRRYA